MLETMDTKEHWERVYRTRQPTEVSWYQKEADLSLRLIREVTPDLSAPLIDVGGGASVLVSQLDGAGYRNLTVLDLAGAAIATARARRELLCEMCMDPPTLLRMPKPTTNVVRTSPRGRRGTTPGRR